MVNVIRTSGQLGPILKQMRKARGWSQIELGGKIGLSQERISVIENHPERIAIDQLLTLLMALGAELSINLQNSLAAKGSTTTVATATLKTRPRENW